MAGKDEETGTGADWLRALFERLKAAVERAADAVCKDEPTSADEAEKLARRAGVIARAARLVDAIRPRVEALAEPGDRPRWEAGRRRLLWRNGSAAYAFSAEDPDSLRGPQFHHAWVDEFCAWRKPEAVLANLRFGLRLGGDPKLAVTTTPRPIPALRRLMAEAGTVTDRAGTAVNAKNLAPGFLAHLKAIYGGTRLEAQELDGVVVEGEGALFRAAELKRARGARPPDLERVGALAEIETGLAVEGLEGLAARMKALSARDLTTVLAALLRGGGEPAGAACAADPREAAEAVARAFAAAAG